MTNKIPLKSALLSFALLAMTVPASAQSSYWPPPLLETTDEARERHEANRYDQYQTRQNQGRDWPPLGGYREPLGDPAPYGTRRPGYTEPQSYDAYGNRGPTLR
ncbi:hypothetical protein LCGC14_1936220 [marine sediment metagenome]|uniref:Uncharacterized protein n=1 Tax=marine sediment metagenome TaxID=412755 RepID=A0A0F9IJ60_9ZZZZ